MTIQTQDGMQFSGKDAAAVVEAMRAEAERWTGQTSATAYMAGFAERSRVFGCDVMIRFEDPAEFLDDCATHGLIEVIE